MTKGSQFTWSNRRPGDAYTERRLDRAIVNQLWLDSCTSLSCSTLLRQRSDHSPFLFDFQQSNSAFVSQFKFLKMWSLHEDCINVIRNSWNIHVAGSAMHILSQKLKHLKNNLKAWNKNTFGNIHIQVKEAETNVLNIQNQIDSVGLADNMLQQQKMAQIHLDRVLDRQETFWKQKAKTKWHIQGDRNTNYFHILAKIKTKTNLISAIKVDETVISDPEQIANHITDHYHNLFTTNMVFLQDSSLVDDVIPNLIDDQANNLLTMLPSEEEIKAALFDMNNDSSPGPDGFGAHFYQTYWQIVKKEVVNVILEFFCK